MATRHLHILFTSITYWRSLENHVNLQSTEPRNLNFQPPEIVSRYRDTQLQVTKN